MAGNGISYSGGIVAAKTPIEHTVTSNGLHIVRIVVAETHQMKKGQAKKNPAFQKYVDAERAQSKTDDEYIDTTTSWHRLTIMGDKAEELVQLPGFNHGALIVVSDASYSEEGDWQTKDGVMRAGRPETIGDKKGSVVIKFEPRNPLPAVWDGLSEVKAAGGGGGGAQREYTEDEGF